MATEWAISEGAERVPLDDQNRGEITFTVTNQGTVADRAVLEAVPGDGADRTWFTVLEPRRLVQAGGSTTFLMSAAAPPGTRPGDYWVQGRVYSAAADAAPEEASRLSGRVALAVKPSVAAKKRPWWPYAVIAALAVAVLVVVAVLVFGSDDTPPSNGSGTQDPVATPDVTNRSLAEAEQILNQRGMTLGEVTEVADATRANGIVVDQSPGPEEPARDDRTVDLAVVANPAPQFTLTVAVTGSGVVSGNGVACPGDCTSALVEGTEVTLTAFANSGSTFDGWGGNCAATTATTCRFTMPRTGVSVSARFSPIPEPPDPNPPVPSVLGLSASAAREVLQGAGFQVTVTSAVDNTCNNLGTVMRQQPTGTTRAPRGSTVTITIGERPAPPRECP